MTMSSRDRDGDSEMASSSGSVSDAPGTGTRTPTGNQQAPSASALAAAASELSPPGSQPHKIAHMPPLNKVKTTDASQVKAAKKTSETPIGEWRSKRSQEEYQRAYDGVIHKNFNLDEFGDPFDERDMYKPLQ